ncbi:MAG TPA: hypothetical protein VHP30_06690 [Ignavibacteriales bacterium]|nr:hypothetical protein [Ignavibacteriales bacterium]
MDNTINLQLNFDGKEANASIQQINANIKELYNSFKYGQKPVDELITSISRGFNNAREIIQGFKEVYFVLNFTIGSTIREYQAFETASFQLSSSLQQAGNYTNEAYQSLLNYASQLQQATVYSNGQYISVMAQYQAMGLTTEQTKEAALQTANLASLMGGDLNSAAVVMKDLFNGNTDSISKYVSGIDETAVKSGNLDQIMQELNGHIGGQAEAFANTSAGSMMQMNNAIGDMQRNIGTILSNGLGPLIKDFASITSSLNTLLPQTTGMVGTFGLLAASLVALRTTGLFPAIISIGSLQASLQTAQVQFKLAAMGGQVFAGSMTAIGTSVKGFFAALGPGGWIILGISALATAVSLLSGKTDELSESEKEAVNGADAEKIKFDLLTQTILDQNASLEARNRAKKEAQELYPGFLSNLSIENTKHSDLAKRQTAFKLMKDCIKKFYKRVRAYRIDHFFFVSRKSFQSFLISTSNIRPIIIVNIKAKSI